MSAHFAILQLKALSDVDLLLACGGLPAIGNPLDADRSTRSAMATIHWSGDGATPRGSPDVGD